MLKMGICFLVISEGVTPQNCLKRRKIVLLINNEPARRHCGITHKTTWVKQWKNLGLSSIMFFRMASVFKLSDSYGPFFVRLSKTTDVCDHSDNLTWRLTNYRSLSHSVTCYSTTCSAWRCALLFMDRNFNIKNKGILWLTVLSL